MIPPKKLAEWLNRLVQIPSVNPAQATQRAGTPGEAQIAAQVGEWSGQEPAIVPYGTNAWAYGELPGECVVLGPGSIDQAHGDVEWVAVSESEKLANIYTRWWEISL